MRNHLFFFSTDAHASPFDINIALDAGFDVVIPYSSVKPEEAEALTHDIIFSRGPKGTKHSGIFVGGSNVDQSERIAAAAARSMFEPFTVSIFSDPKGAYTTAAALVAKVKKAANGLSGKKAVIFGGTGPVGSVAAVLCAREGATATIVTSRDAAAGQAAAADLSRNHGVTIHGAAAGDPQSRLELMRGADVAIATVKAGVQVVSKDLLETLDRPVIVADVNAVPPSGFGGLDPHDDAKKIAPHVHGIGALAIGVVKYKTQVELYKLMLKKKSRSGFEAAYELAQALA